MGTNPEHCRVRPEIPLFRNCFHVGATITYAAAAIAKLVPDYIGDLVRNPKLNHRAEVLGGVRADECGALLREFFAHHRK